MQFTSKLTGLLVAIAASAMSVQALAAAPRDAEAQLAALSVVLFDGPGFGGTSITPSGLQEGTSFNLPSEWVDRVRSLIVSDGYVCGFYVAPESNGPATFLSGANSDLPGSIDQSIESFTCFKTL